MSKKKKFYFVVQERRRVVIEVESENVDDARRKVEAAYSEGKVCLNDPGYIDNEGNSSLFYETDCYFAKREKNGAGSLKI